MKFLKLIPIFFIFTVVFPFTNLVYANNNDPNSYKVLSSTSKRLSITNVETFLKEGDLLIKKGDFEKAKESFDKARSLSKQLAGFYSDLNDSFSKLDARIPAEMAEKGKNSLKIWAEANSRLAALYIRKEQSEVAVPLLVEIIRLMAPSSTEGKEAYKKLIQLGFVDTPYRGL